MKKTNVELFRSATRWLRILPLLLGLALLSSSDLAAQNYKSPEDATIAVKEALEPIQDAYPTTAHIKQGQMTPSQRQNLFTGNYLGLFLDILTETQNVATAVDRLDEMASPEKPTDRLAQTLVARDYLMDLITN